MLCRRAAEPPTDVDAPRASNVRGNSRRRHGRPCFGGADDDRADRLGEALQPHAAAGQVRHSVDLASEMDDALAGQDLPWTRDRAEPRREVQRAAPVSPVDGHRLADVEADPDAERKVRIGRRLRREALLKRDRRSQRLSWRPKHRERLVAPELDQVAAVRGHLRPYHVAEPSRQGAGRLVAVLLRESRVAADIRDQERPNLCPGRAVIVRSLGSLCVSWIAG